MVLLAIAHRYGPEKFGNISLAITIAEIFRTAAEFGIDTVCIRRFSQCSEAEQCAFLPRMLSTKIQTAGFFFVVAIGTALILSGTPNQVALTAVAGLSIFLANIVSAFSALFQSRFAMSRVLIATSWSVAFYVLLSFVAIEYEWPLLVVISLLPLSELLNGIFLWRQGLPRSVLQIDHRASRDLLRESLPMGLMAIMVILYFRFDNFVVFKLEGSAALGLYAAAYRLSEPALMVCVAFSTTLYVLLSGTRDDPRLHVKLWPMVLRTMWPAYGFILLVSSGLFFWGQLLLRFISPNYLAASDLLKVLALVLLVRTVNVSLTSILNSRGQYSVLAKITAICLVVNIVSSITLVSLLGVPGAAWSALITEAFNAVAQGRAVVEDRSVVAAVLTVSDARIQ